MRKKILFYLFMLGSFVICCSENDRYQAAIQYAKSDSALIEGLYLEEAKEDLSKLQKGKFGYIVHSQIVNEVFDQEGEFCLEDFKVSEQVMDYFKSTTNRIDSTLTEYSSSDSANMHLFFTDEFDNYLGLFVFYFEGRGVSERYRKFPYLWYSNHGIFYFFKFKEGTSVAEEVCKLKLLYD